MIAARKVESAENRKADAEFQKILTAYNNGTLYDPSYNLYKAIARHHQKRDDAWKKCLIACNLWTKTNDDWVPATPESIARDTAPLEARRANYMCHYCNDAFETVAIEIHDGNRTCALCANP